MAILLSKITILGIIILIAVVSISAAACFYIASQVDKHKDGEE